jgi:O-antigen/teichoic acid export membrane protein
MKRVFLYNAVIGAQTLLALVFQFAFAWRFGASASSDAYFAGMTVFALMAGVAAFFTHMFMQYYNDLKVKDAAEAGRFYQAVITVSLAAGAAAFAVLAVFAEPLARAFAPGFSAQSAAEMRSFVLVIGGALVWNRAVALNNALINAEMRFLLPYLLGLLAPAFNISALLFFSGRYGINAIAWATLASGLLSLLATSAFIKRDMGLGFSFRPWHPAIPGLARDSFSIRSAYQLWALREPVAVNFLSRFPAGNLSLYFYAVRMLSALLNIASTPVVHVFAARTSRLVSSGSFAEVRRLMGSASLRSAVLFAAACLPLAVFLPELLRTFFPHKFSLRDMGHIHLMFLSLIPAYALVAAEMPFNNVVAAMKMGRRAISISAGGVLLFLAALYVAAPGSGMYAVSIAMGTAAAAVTGAYALSAREATRNP